MEGRAPPARVCVLIERRCGDVVDLLPGVVPHAVGGAAGAVVDEHSFVADWHELPPPRRFLDLTKRLASQHSQLGQVGLHSRPLLERGARQVGDWRHVA